MVGDSEPCPGQQDYAVSLQARSKCAPPDKPFLRCVTSSPSSGEMPVIRSRWWGLPCSPACGNGASSPAHPVSTEPVTTQRQQCGTAAPTLACPAPAASATRADPAPSLPAGRMLWAGLWQGGCLSTQRCLHSGCHAVNAPQP